MILASVSFLRTENGGRQGPLTSGYRGQFHWGDNLDEPFEGSMEVIPERWIQPGESTEARFTFTEASTKRLENRIRVGDSFQLREGRKIVATGIITAVET